MKDKIITCIQCGITFVFTAREKERFLAYGFDTPKRCPECRKKKARGIPMSNGWRNKEKRRQNRRKEEYDFFE